MLRGKTIAAMTVRFFMPPDVTQDIYKDLRDPDALAMAGVLPTHHNYIQAIHRDAYFYVEGQPNIVRTELGTRPGDSFADVVLGYLWSRILGSSQQHLVDPRILEAIDCSKGIWLGETELSETPVLGTTWCDGLCIMLADDTGQVFSRCATAASVLLDLCRSYAMSRRAKQRFYYASEGISRGTYADNISILCAVAAFDGCLRA